MMSDEELDRPLYMVTLAVVSGVSCIVGFAAGITLAVLWLM